MKILAIETSCDETAVALLEASGGLKTPRFKILENLVASQIKIHAPFGGVVPNLAKREHLRNLPILWQRIMNNELRIKSKNKKFIIHNSKFVIPKIDLIAVTVGPGLEPCLWTGINFAKELYGELRIMNKELRILGVNHLEGHLYSHLLNSKFYILYPAISLIVSGGHTILLYQKSLTNYKKLGETRDDAAGECFDKVARMLDLPYPGGPELEKLAKRGDPTSINFPRPMLKQKNYDFSFSGLKTSVLYYLRDNKKIEKKDVAASFEAAAIEVLLRKTLRAAENFKARTIMVSGGVVANRELRKKIRVAARRKKLNLLIPDFQFCTDNAAMIAAAGYLSLLRGKKRGLSARGNLSI
ncbi:tRNA (adenosine(37)-N6)-threonylcarbamoyltransferase complex transferase subunit TsaD [Candidatus Wolfebacteria bacterium]|nr:tRNA (adenosine(37)-N6)-threonylcarbamoyltransferase complex transferase subunit TsaD [Candidatus Wolfebacteria bacterium]